MPSYRFDEPYFADGYHFGNRGLGVLAENIPPYGTDGPSAFYPSLQFPSDVGTEIRGVLLTQPLSGTFTIEEDGTCKLIGAADGVHTATLQMYQDGADEGVLTLTFYINATTAVSSDFDGAYTIVGTVQSDLDANYALIGRVTQDLDGTYSVHASVVADFDAEYLVLSESVVISDFDGTYGIAGKVESDLDAAYNVIGAVTQDMDGAYVVRGAVEQDLTGAYNVIGAASQDLDGAYSVAGIVISDFDGGYAIQGETGPCPTADEIAEAVWSRILTGPRVPGSAGSMLQDTANRIAAAL